MAQIGNLGKFQSLFDLQKILIFQAAAGMRETSEANQFLDREPRRSMEGLPQDGEGFG